MSDCPFDDIYRKQDQDNENYISNFLQDYWNCSMEKQDHYDKFDYLVKRKDKIVGFVEIRCRSHNYGDFANCYISLTKKIRADELRKATGLPCKFVVAWQNALGHVDLNQTFELTRSGKKWSRRSNPEISELLCIIPIEKFTLIKEINNEPIFRQV